MRRVIAIVVVLAIASAVIIALLPWSEGETDVEVTSVREDQLDNHLPLPSTEHPKSRHQSALLSTLISPVEAGRMPRWTDLEGFPSLNDLVGMELAKKIRGEQELVRRDLPIIGRAVRDMDKLILEKGRAEDELTNEALQENSSALQRAYYLALREVVGGDVDPEAAAKLDRLDTEMERLKREMKGATPEELAEALGALKVETLTGESRMEKERHESGEAKQ